jgi:O-antigen ligase
MTSLLVQDQVKYRYAALVMGEYQHYYGDQSQRLGMYEDAIRQFFSNPVLGLGTTGFYPHNIVLEIASEWGSIGLLIFLYFIITTARVTATLLPNNILDLRKDEMFKTWAAMCFVCALLNSQVSGSIATNSLIWFASGCLIAARNTFIRATE